MGLKSLIQATRQKSSQSKVQPKQLPLKQPVAQPINHRPQVSRVYVQLASASKIEKWIDSGQGECSLIHCRRSIVFRDNLAAMDHLIRKGWAACPECFGEYFNGQTSKIVLVK